MMDNVPKRRHDGQARGWHEEVYHLRTGKDRRLISETCPFREVEGYVQDRVGN